MKKIIILIFLLSILSGCKTPDEKLIELVKEDFILKNAVNFIDKLKFNIDYKIEHENLSEDKEINENIKKIINLIPNEYKNNLPTNEIIKDEVKKLNQELKSNGGLQNTLIEKLGLK
jgi:hypothetical protein